MSKFMKTFLMLLFSFTAICFADAKEPLKKLNIKQMFAASCLAASRIEDKQSPGGFGTSDNLPRSIPKDLRNQSGKLSLFVRTNETVPFGKDHKGFELYL